MTATMLRWQSLESQKYPTLKFPYHTEIMERFGGIDLEAARRVSGNGFYYLLGDIARLHEAVLAYARDFMINKGFTYAIPPFMIHGNVVQGVMSFPEMEAMMYKIEGEDLYLIGTSEHSMIGRYIDQILPESQLPQTLTSYSPCFRKEKGAHGLEERGVYRIHQFEKQEMIVVCKPEESMDWYEKLWRYSVELFQSLDIPVRQLECCSGDLADLKVKSCDIEAWSPRQKKYFEGLQLLQLGRCTGTPLENPCKRRGRQKLLGTHPQQYLCGSSSYADCIFGKQSASRWQRKKFPRHCVPIWAVKPKSANSIKPVCITLAPFACRRGKKIFFKKLQKSVDKIVLVEYNKSCAANAV